MLMSVYDAFGLDAWVYNFGNPEGIGTHVVTLVNIDGQVIVQDAHLNAEVTGNGGGPLDVREAISLIAADDREETRVLYEQGTRRCLTDDPSQCAGSWMVPPGEEIQCTKRDSYPFNNVCEIPNFTGTSITYDARFWSNVSAFLEQQGLDPSYQSLMLFPINLTGVDGIAISDEATVEGVSQELYNDLATAIKD